MVRLGLFQTSVSEKPVAKSSLIRAEETDGSSVYTRSVTYRPFMPIDIRENSVFTNILCDFNKKTGEILVYFGK